MDNIYFMKQWINKVILNNFMIKNRKYMVLHVRQEGEINIICLEST